jgi:uncharacterized protein (DUF1778 family)
MAEGMLRRAGDVRSALSHLAVLGAVVYVVYHLRYAMFGGRPMSASPRHRDPVTRAVNLRVREDIRDLIDRAARGQGRSRSDFMIDAARCAAEEALLDQTLVRVDQQTFDHFLAVLDEPAAGEGYERLMNAATPWKD